MTLLLDAASMVAYSKAVDALSGVSMMDPNKISAEKEALRGMMLKNLSAESRDKYLITGDVLALDPSRIDQDEKDAKEQEKAYAIRVRAEEQARAERIERVVKRVEEIHEMGERAQAARAVIEPIIQLSAEQFTTQIAKKDEQSTTYLQKSSPITEHAIESSKERDNLLGLIASPNTTPEERKIFAAELKKLDAQAPANPLVDAITLGDKTQIVKDVNPKVYDKTATDANETQCAYKLLYKVYYLQTYNRIPTDKDLQDLAHSEYGECEAKEAIKQASVTLNLDYADLTKVHEGQNNFYEVFATAPDKIKELEAQIQSKQKSPDQVAKDTATNKAADIVKKLDSVSVKDDGKPDEASKTAPSTPSAQPTESKQNQAPATQTPAR
jgi:hypothetical protein